jgi:hypothetical protein
MLPARASRAREAGSSLRSEWKKEKQEQGQEQEQEQQQQQIQMRGFFTAFRMTAGGW